MKFPRRKTIVTTLVVLGVVSAAGYILASSPVSDTFTDTNKIASNVNLTVDTSAGQVKLATSSTWTCGNALVDSRDSKSYSTVLIDTQCWMAQGMDIGTRVAGSATQGTSCSSIEKYCYSDSDSNCTTYGGLYQWDQAMCGSTTSGAVGICPSGWHLPTDAEQNTLDQYVWGGSGSCNATRSGSYDCSPGGTALKTGGSSGFNGLLAGYRNTGGTFSDQGTLGYFWSSTQSSTNAWLRLLSSGQAGVYRNVGSKAYGFSVRCLKD